MVRTFNINELLERKKDIEAQITRESNLVTLDSLSYIKDIVTDHTRTKDNVRTTEQRPKVTIEEYTQKMNSLGTELASIKSAIQDYNAKEVLGLLAQRDSLRLQIEYFKKIQSILPTEKKQGSRILRRGEKGETLEDLWQIAEPMFDYREIEKRIDELSAEQRKINTEIQRRNLNAKIEL